MVFSGIDLIIFLFIVTHISAENAQPWGLIALLACTACDLTSVAVMLLLSIGAPFPQH